MVCIWLYQLTEHAEVKYWWCFFYCDLESRVLSFTDLAKVMFELKCGCSIHGLYAFDFRIWLTIVNTIGAISILDVASLSKSLHVSVRGTGKWTILLSCCFSLLNVVLEYFVASLCCQTYRLVVHSVSHLYVLSCTVSGPNIIFLQNHWWGFS